MSIESKWRWCAKVLGKKVMDITKEFFANKRCNPTTVTTAAYDGHFWKNRYDDVLCIDETRVVLKNRPTDDDYIHANWVTMPDGEKYICTQSPMAETLSDFWHMVVTEKSNVVVLIKSPGDEKKNEIYNRYFPIEKTEEDASYKVLIKEKKEDPIPGIGYQILEITGGEAPWLVHLFVHDSWKTHSVPASPVPTVALHKLSKKTASGAPITVVGSAGIGRSGIFVGIDYAIQKIGNDDLNDVFISMGRVIPEKGPFERFVANYLKLLNRYEKKNSLLIAKD